MQEAETEEESEAVILIGFIPNIGIFMLILGNHLNILLLVSSRQKYADCSYYTILE